LRTTASAYEADEWFAKGRSDLALAALAQIVREDVNDPITTSRLLVALTYFRVFLPIASLYGTGTVEHASFSLDSQRIVAIAKGQTICVYDATNGQIISRFRPPETPISVQFDPAGSSLLVTSVDGSVRLLDTQTGEPVSKIMPHTRGLRTAQFSKDGELLLTVSGDETIRVWEAKTGRPVGKSLRVEGQLQSARLSPQGRFVLTLGKSNGPARIWDARTGDLICKLSHGLSVRAAEFSPDDSRVVTITFWEKDVRVWDARTGNLVCVPLSHNNDIAAAEFSFDGKQLLTKPSIGDAANVWDLETGELIIALKHEAELDFAHFSSDGKKVVTGSLDRTARVWDARTGKLLMPLAHKHGVLWAAFTPDDTRILTLSGDGSPRVWDARTGELISSLAPHDDYVRSGTSTNGGSVVTFIGMQTPDDRRWRAQFSPNGNRALLEREIGPTLLCDTSDGRPITKVDVEKNRANSAAKWLDNSPDGQLVVMTGARPTNPPDDIKRLDPTNSWVSVIPNEPARVYYRQTGKAVTSKSLPHNGLVSFVRFGGNSRWIVRACGELARVWDAYTGQPVSEALRHDQAVNLAEFSPDSRFLATLAGDTAIRLWYVRASLPVSEFLQADAPVKSIRFGSDAQSLVTITRDSAYICYFPLVDFSAPSWLPDVAEAIVETRRSDHGIFEEVPSVRILELKHDILASQNNDYFTLWARWFFTDRTKRGIVPLLTNSLPAFSEPAGSDGRKWEDRADTQFNLALMYARGATQDPGKAANLFRKAAEQGHSGAQFFLGLSYHEGSGVIKDEAEAVKWIYRAGAQGHADAQLLLGKLFLTGTGVPQSATEAATWFRKAADQGNPEAQCNLGICYSTGLGIVKDNNEALKWLKSAAAQGFERANTLIPSLENQEQSQ
jgi:WD40 repeat protein/TPR repeat protein